MFKKSLSISFIVLASVVLFSACNLRNDEGITPVELEATVNVIVQENLEEQAQTQATIEAAVQATQIAVESQATPIVVEEAVYELTEEELTALIDEAVTAALEASDEVTTTTTQATSDSSVSDEEVVYVTYAVTYADEAIAYAESLLDVYYEEYGENAEEAINALYEIESELESISTSLDEMEELLYQGTEAVNAALTELNAAAVQMEEKLTMAQEQTQQWMSEYQAALQNRTSDLSNLQPNMEAGDRSQMIDMVNGFAAEIQNGLADGVLNSDEIQRITQSGINSSAAIEKFGGPQMQGWSDSISNLTRMASEGRTMDLQSGLNSFSGGLPELNRRR